MMTTFSHHGNIQRKRQSRTFSRWYTSEEKVKRNVNEFNVSPPTCLPKFCDLKCVDRKEIYTVSAMSIVHQNFSFTESAFYSIKIIFI